jgi:hypothetical protein
MMLCRTFECKSLKKVRFLNTANTNLGHEKENLVQFAANEFSRLFHKVSALTLSAEVTSIRADAHRGT